MTVTREDIKGLVAKGIPEQTNFCDCGVYLVGYITEFLKNPGKFVQKVFSRELDRNNDFAGFDPAGKRREIRDELLRLEREQAVAKKKQKKAKALARITAQDKPTSPTSSSTLLNGAPEPGKSRDAIPVPLPPSRGSPDAEGPDVPNQGENQTESGLLEGIEHFLLD